MLKTILLAGVAVVALLLAYAATRPDTFRVERSATVKAAPERIFALINDLHLFNTWNPYEKKDTAIKGEYTGNASGPGAAYAWQSNKVGVGQMEIVDASSPERITMKLDFVKPFEAHNVAEFMLKPQGGATEVTWSMHGPVPYVSKLIGVFFNMDRMIGKDFEDGLGNLKNIAEAG
ncbi:SRPBCC family protein [Paraburkholderia sp. BL10I2N1]|uniref:SRPBCC family protein n=1 Tax=Paraburkholderia sp. BL10I2N1 TaxID=1938796 RepID=UPI00105BB0F2|nr:SRPBCC family protein [Paraburkholderia sp. BL10I2N1]TDN62643.1 uncharacterized protein YndB with AHSA1/START domain [Paraburkholderia sp. BL10I2N1]